MKRITFLLITLLIILSAFSMGKDTTIVEGLYYMDKEPISIKIVNGRIVEFKHLLEKTDVPKVLIAPGLIDIQINGYMGVDFAGPYLTLNEIRKATRELWKEGVTTYLPTLITNKHQALRKILLFWLRR